MMPTIKPTCCMNACTLHRIKTLGLSRTRLFNSNASCNSLDLDPTEHRYLLCGAADASVSVYDTHVGAHRTA